MKETSKAVMRRLHDNRFGSRYLVGEGIDIGAGADPISLYRELFPRMGEVRAWEVPDGDAQYMAGIADDTYDFVHSSHCLEHLRDPQEGLANWFRILKPGGHLICLVPDEDLYEQGFFPSRHNGDHKWTFTITKPASWCERSINLFQLLPTLGAQAEVLRVELLDATFRYTLPQFDQTLTPVGESAIEFVIRKRLPEEVTRRGRIAAEGRWTPEDVYQWTGLRVTIG